jgi:hypothetical protein
MKLCMAHLQTHLDIVYPQQGRGLVAEGAGTEEQEEQE